MAAIVAAVAACVFAGGAGSAVETDYGVRLVGPIAAASGTGSIQFTVFNGGAGQTNVIQASTDLFTWTAISTNVFPSTACPICPFIDFQDPASTNLDRRYYRAVSFP